MAFDVTPFIIAGLASLPGIAALINARTQKREASVREDATAYQAAKDFYAGTLDEYKEELARARQGRKLAEQTSEKLRRELEVAQDKRVVYEMQISMLTKEVSDLTKQVAAMQAKLKNEDSPTEEQ